MADPLKPERRPVKRLQDVPYLCGMDALTSEEHLLDLYIPVEPLRKGPCPLVVYLKGGAWTDRSKEGHISLGMTLAEAADVVLLIPNYRLSPKKLPSGLEHPVHVVDAATAILFVLDHAKEYSVDPSQVFLIGHSAGGHMAGLLTLQPKHYFESARAQLRACRSESASCSAAVEPSIEALPQIRGAVGISGIYDLVAIDADFPSYRDMFLQFAFGPFSPDAYRQASPTNMQPDVPVSSIPRWLLLHSPNDTLVNLRQSSDFQKHLQNLGVSQVRLDTSLSGGHFDDVLGVGAGEDEDQLLRILVDFLLQVQ
eukprot:CAMPEP_0174244448 /NCGR_PEP_ID=MMETSP0417-20130205/35283_1 /TAXON_ID=242541 /ORGANISM="Mayorella sp, Strain BSH-02190019" /LENGTH=310 /DNA_ID=CAMNT_0015324135 /DNA_START=32 /DNA_END=964 /DNA_ORIENTATION=+